MLVAREGSTNVSSVPLRLLANGVQRYLPSDSNVFSPISEELFSSNVTQRTNVRTCYFNNNT